LKKIKKISVIFEKLKIIFWSEGFPPLAQVGPKRWLGAPGHTLLIFWKFGQ
jgi:hypothetical protein